MTAVVCCLTWTRDVIVAAVLEGWTDCRGWSRILSLWSSALMGPGGPRRHHGSTNPFKGYTTKVDMFTSIIILSMQGKLHLLCGPPKVALTAYTSNDSTFWAFFSVGKTLETFAAFSGEPTWLSELKLRQLSANFWPAYFFPPVCLNPFCFPARPNHPGNGFVAPWLVREMTRFKVCHCHLVFFTQRMVRTWDVSLCLHHPGDSRSDFEI